jgi:hypothetical protein
MAKDDEKKSEEKPKKEEKPKEEPKGEWGTLPYSIDPNPDRK